MNQHKSTNYYLTNKLKNASAGQMPGNNNNVDSYLVYFLLHILAKASAFKYSQHQHNKAFLLFLSDCVGKFELF